MITKHLISRFIFTSGLPNLVFVCPSNSGSGTFTFTTAVSPSLKNSPGIFATPSFNFPNCEKGRMKKWKKKRKRKGQGKNEKERREEIREEERKKNVEKKSEKNEWKKVKVQ